MREKRFRVQVTEDSRGRALIVVPFDPDEAWGAKAVHHVNGTVNGCRVRVTIAPGDSGWAFTLNPRLAIAVGSEVTVALAPEGPQRGDLADDIADALTANPAAGAFFDTLAQFYRKGYLRYIDATTRRPDVRAARIAEVVDLLAAGIKERPRPLSLQPFRTCRATRMATQGGHIGGMKRTRIITAAAGFALAAGLVGALAVPSLASTSAAEHKILGTLTLHPGGLRATATGSQLEVVDATGSGQGWQVVIGGDVRITSVQCAPHSTCTLPVPGVVGNVITADPGTGMGAMIFNWTVSGPVTVNLTTAP
jgi:hypothetical protein